jgi:hypothetical protein
MDLVSGMPASQFEDESSWRIRAGSKFKRFMCIVSIDVRRFYLRRGYAYYRLNTTDLNNRLTDVGEVVRFTRRPPFTPQEHS